jgi:hypothetical protein
MGMLYKKTNLYTGAAGRYIWAYPPDKFVALIKYPEGFCKSKSCYSMEEAVDFVENDYDKYKTGQYYDNDGRLVVLRKKGDVRRERMF